ncbi:MAG TPA: 5'/3'-nucleotidase SurE [Geminicoccaceae bacterium]|nr:5'/3'-nucleotidase SurE [Geminicoccaceae bacterium]
MRILLTNDDGINAPGLVSLERIARTRSDDVWIVAPETDQSGTSHSLTTRRPLRIRQVDERRYAIDGTPTDCVLLALQVVLKGARVDLVLSGVNRGFNIGEDVHYSGTVSAAMEATIFNLPAVAFSQACRQGVPVNWATAERFGPEVLSRLLTTGWPEDTFVNVNFPDRPVDDVRGIQVAALGKRKVGDEIVERVDPRGEPYVWIGGLTTKEINKQGTDIAAIHQGYITVTPVTMDMTHRASLASLRRAFE